MAAAGYPEAPKPGAEIDLSGLDGAPDALVFHAGTKKAGKNWIATGGRVLTIVGRGADVAAARAKAYELLARVRAPGLVFRRDIAARPLGKALAAE
jgi:phosphoribosylamine--glycine ligase